MQIQNNGKDKYEDWNGKNSNEWDDEKLVVD